MRDSSLDSLSFCEEVDRICESIVTHDKFLRSTVSDISKRQSSFENSFRITRNGTEFLLTLTILSWYIPDEIRILTQFALEEKWSRKDDRILGEILLKSKGHCLNFLLQTQLFHTRDFFGNILNEKKVGIFRDLRPNYVSRRKVKRKIRHRGYRDKGTLKLAHEYHDFSDCTSLHLRIEEERKTYQDSLLFLEGWIT